jgi:hypothetical protein
MNENRFQQKVLDMQPPYCTVLRLRRRSQTSLHKIEFECKGYVWQLLVKTSKILKCNFFMYCDIKFPALEYTGGVPYDLLKPVLQHATAEQLFLLEHYNPYLIEETGELWQFHCQREFRSEQRQDMETAREMYMVSLRVKCSNLV